MIYFVLALIVAILIFSIYILYKKGIGKKELVMRIGLSIALIFFTYVSKTIFIHKPIFVLHLALLILSWIYLFKYIFKGELNIWMILSPAVTTALFFSVALFFRENA